MPSVRPKQIISPFMKSLMAKRGQTFNVRKPTAPKQRKLQVERRGLGQAPRR